MLKSNRKRTFFVIMKLVPIATELERASNRPMYLSSMASLSSLTGAAVKPMEGKLDSELVGTGNQ
jgi:hypothetical protein